MSLQQIKPPGTSAPLFIGNNYYITKLEHFMCSHHLYGMQCEGGCYNHTGMPWFIKSIPIHTTDATNVRVWMRTPAMRILE